MSVERPLARDDSDSTGEDRGSLLAAVSDRLVRLHKELFGKGPERARAYYQGDLLVVVMRDGFTGFEQTLKRAGRVDVVTQHRLISHNVARERFTAAVEELTGRSVIAFMSGVHHEPDVVADMFLLEPRVQLEDRSAA